MLQDDGWFDWAVKVPGPPDKVYSQVNTMEMFIPHSAVGYLAGWMNRLMSTERYLPGHPKAGRYTPHAAASITGWIFYDGRMLQHYSTFVSCWGSGHRIPNTRGNAFEHEGGAPGAEMELFTPEQTATDIHIVKDIQEYHLRHNNLPQMSKWAAPRRPTHEGDLAAQFYEHNECRRWGAAPTACLSQRLRVGWGKIVAAANEKEDDVDDRLDQKVMQLDGSGPRMFTVLDAGAPGGTKKIPLSYWDLLRYDAQGLVVNDTKVTSAVLRMLVEHAQHPDGGAVGSHTHEVTGRAV